MHSAGSLATPAGHPWVGCLVGAGRGGAGRAGGHACGRRAWGDCASRARWAETAIIRGRGRGLGGDGRELLPPGMPHRSPGDAADDGYASDTDLLLPEHAGSVARSDRREPAAQPYVIVMFTLLGTGCLTPWNSFAGAVDFFGALLPRCDAASAFAVANFSANLLFLVIQLRFCKCFAPRAIIGLVLYVVILCFPLWLASAFYAPIPDSQWALEETVFLALVTGVGIAGAANAGLQVRALLLQRRRWFVALGG